MVIYMFSGNQATPENPAAAPRASGRLCRTHMPLTRTVRDDVSYAGSPC